MKHPNSSVIVPDMSVTVFFSYRGDRRYSAALTSADHIVRLYGNQFISGGFSCILSGRQVSFDFEDYDDSIFDLIDYIFEMVDDEDTLHTYWNRNLDHIPPYAIEDYIERIVDWLPESMWLW